MKTYKIAALALSGVSLFTTVQAQSILIDDFTDGSSFTDQNTSGTASYNYISGAADIVGGSRQVRARAAGSGFYGPSVIAVDTTADTLTSYGGDTGDRFLQYGSAIGSQTFTGSGPGAPVNLNLALNLSDSFSIGVVSAGAGDSVGITLIAADSTQYSDSINISSTGTYTLSLSSFSGLTGAEASDIDGLLISPISGASSAPQGLVLNNLSITEAPEPSALALLGLGSLLFATFWRRQFVPAPGLVPRPVKY
jgi:hypothetical protein